jgi:hypothetical protein
MPVQATTTAMGGFSGEKMGRGVDSQFHVKHIQTRIGFISPSNSIKQFHLHPNIVFDIELQYQY